MTWYLKACPACHADLHDDADSPGWTICFMCGRSFRLSDIQGRGADDATSENTADGPELERRRRRSPRELPRSA
jgi:hypothetical protein